MLPISPTAQIHKVVWKLQNLTCDLNNKRTIEKVTVENAEDVLNVEIPHRKHQSLRFFLGFWVEFRDVQDLSVYSAWKS
jgi:hypothetical protein